jgi:hypothetical protein
MKNCIRPLVFCFLVFVSALAFRFPLARAAENPVSADTIRWENNADYEVLFRDGATGSFAVDKTIQRDGAPSLRLTKTNGIGYIEVRANQPVPMQLERRYTMRGYFHAQNAPLSSLLLFRLGAREASNFGNPYGLYNYTSNNHIPNAPPGVWEKRAATYIASQQPDADANFAQNIAPENAFVHALLIGNPCTVWLDKIEVTPANDAGGGPSQKTLTLPYPEAQVQQILQARTPSVLQLKSGNGRSFLTLNSQAEAPAMYMSSRNNLSQGDYQAFGQADVPVMIVPVNMEFSDSAAQAWQAKEKYNFARVEEDIVLALRKNPHANLMLLVGAYAPPNWGAQNLDDVWQNAAAEKAYKTQNAAYLNGFARETQDGIAREKMDWYPSYHSRRWRAEASEFIRALFAHLSQTPYGKAIVGTQIMAGIDGRAQLGAADFSPAALSAFRNWLHAKYATPAALSKAWRRDVASFDAVQIPIASDAVTLGADTSGKPYIFDPAVADYRTFRRADVWKMMDELSGAAKAGLGKPSIAAVYRDLEPEFLDTQNIDLIGNDSYYPFRRPGWASAGWTPFRMGFHGKMQFQDLDLRSFAGPQESGEVMRQMHAASRDKNDWLATHKKLVGLSLAHDAGWWYYEMWGYFNDDGIIREIKHTTDFARRLASREYSQSQKAPAKWRPDVLVVTAGTAGNYARVPYHSLARSLGTSDIPYEQDMMFSTSGVPHDTAFLRDVMQQKELQNYKIYIFPHVTFLSDAERAFIEKLKTNNRTIIWVYDTGYIGENGLDVAAMSRLVGMKIGTEEKWARRTPLVTSASPLSGKVLPLQGTTELAYNNFRLHGLDTGKAPGQAFWIDDESVTPLLHYNETGQIAGAMKKFKNWTSVYLAAPGGLGNDLLYEIATQSGAYVAMNSGHEFHTNGNFATLHALRSETVTLILPRGAKTVRDADSGKLLPVASDKSDRKICNLDVTAQTTYWLLFE